MHTRLPAFLTTILTCILAGLPISFSSAIVAQAQEPANPVSAEDQHARRWLPGSTVLYAEAVSTQTLLNLPITQSILKTDLFKEIWRSPDVMKARGGITVAEVALGERLPEALGKLTDGGWLVAFDANTRGAVLLTHARDAEACQQLYKKLTDFAVNDAKNKGQELKQINYREVDAYELNGAVIAAVNDWLLVSNKGELAKLIVDNYHLVKEDSAKAPARSDLLIASRRFKEFEAKRAAATATESERAIAWTWVDLEQIKASGTAKELFEQPDDNFAAELLVGGMLACARGASTLTAQLNSAADGLHLTIAVPHPAVVKAARYQYFFGKPGQQAAPAPIRLAGSQAFITMHRDVAELWQRAGDIFGQKTNDELAQAETTLTTLFSGRDFASDILGALQPELQVVVVEQAFGQGDAPVPQIKLPAFALVSRLRDPAVMQPQLKRIFMSLIGFLNIAGAMNQQPQLDIEVLKPEGATQVTATYSVDVDRPRNWVVPVQYNFSPTLLMVGEHAVISSTRPLAESILTELRKPNAVAVKADNVDPTNTHLKVDGPLIAGALAANREQMISQNMIEKGHTAEEAAREIDMVLRIAKMIQSIELRFTAGNDAALDVDLKLAP